MTNLFHQIRRLASHKMGRLFLALSLLVVAFSGARFEFHAHMSATSQDADAHGHVDHDATGEHSHSLALDSGQDGESAMPDPAKSGLHAHELGALVALPVVHASPQVGVWLQSRLPMPPSAAADVLPSAPPIRPPIV